MTDRQQYMCPKCDHRGASVLKDAPVPLCSNHKPPIPMCPSHNGEILMHKVDVQFGIMETLDVLVKCEQLFIGEITIPAMAFLALATEWWDKSEGLREKLPTPPRVDPTKLN